MKEKILTNVRIIDPSQNIDEIGDIIIDDRGKIKSVGKSEKKQIFLDGKFVTRVILPLSLSYDHRIIDGAEAARFNNDLKENLGKNFAYKLAV